MPNFLLCPSMMCANFRNLEAEVKHLDEADVDIFHLDIMDGHFVPNFGMGLQDVETIRKLTNKPIDVHLMIEDAASYIDLFASLGVDIIYVHPETDPQIARTLQSIKNHGIKVGLAINPGTALETVQELLPLVDYLMIMTVNPGFAGQKYLDYVDAKIEKAVALKDIYSYQVMVDGAIAPAVIERLSAKGVEGFILGTSTLFNKDESYKEIISHLKQTLEVK